VQQDATIQDIHALVEYEPTISVLERAKTVRALDRAATAIGNYRLVKIYLILLVNYAIFVLP
jgi:hypothetical protein